MLKCCLLDMPPAPALVEKTKQSGWLIIIALVALAAIIGYVAWRRKRKKTGGA